MTQPPLTIKSKYSHSTHCTPRPSENTQSHHPNHPTLVNKSPQSTDLTTSSTNLVSTTPSQHHPHPANTLIPPHSSTGLDISGNHSLPTFFRNFTFFNIDYIDGLVQNCSLSIVNALEILHSCTKPSVFDLEDNVAQIHLPGWQFYLPWVRVIKFNSLSGDSEQRGPYSPYKPCNHSLYRLYGPHCLLSPERPLNKYLITHWNVRQSDISSPVSSLSQHA